MPRWIPVILICSLASPALAQSKAERKQVKVLNEEGIEAFESGDFARAAQKFQEAWKIKPDPTLRKNEAIAWFKAKNCKNASEAATSFLGSDANSPEDVAEVNTILANCRVEYARQAMAYKDYELARTFLSQAEYLATLDVTKENISQARLELAKLESQTSPVVQAPTDLPHEETPRDAPIWPYVAAGTGAAILATAIIYHIVSVTSTASEYEDVAKAGNDRARYDELASSLDTARWLVPTLYVVGAATTGVGAYFLMGHGTETQASAPVSAGITFSGRF